jgi:membrane-bound lytic murein transglycosylase D
MRPALRAALIFVVLASLTGRVEARDSLPAQSAARPLLQATTPPTKESFAERKAVRGVALEGSESSESPELRALRRFEEQAFPRHGAAIPSTDLPDDAAQPLPPGLEGRWGGTGDIPRELRSPERGLAPLPQRPSLDWMRQLVQPELPVRWEPQVIRYLEFFKNDPKGRAIMTSWLRKMGRYRVVIEHKLEEQGLPKDLIYLAMVESGFDPGATSQRSAGGVWQFIPGAARAYGLEVSHWVDARRDPERAAEAAARLLKDLYVRFGSWPLAFAAYNAGYGAILRSIARYNTNDFWELARHEAGLPWETTLYVPKILAAAVVGHNLKAFGFADVALDPPWEFDRVEVPSGTSFGSLARAAGTRPDVIEDLNPEFVCSRIPPDRGPVVMRVPLGSASLFAKAANDTRTNGERLQPVVLRFGETLDDVAKARGISVRELKRINGASDTADLRGGMTILVPARTAPPAPPATEDVDDSILVAVPDRAFAYQGREQVFYRTRDGDTLAEIAGAFDVTPDDIVEWNHIDPDAKLQPKLIFQLFVREGFDRSNMMLLDPDKVRVVTLGSEEFLELEAARRGKTRLFYSARAGDSLAKIAKRYGLAPGDLARVNRLSATSELGEGQKVVVYSPTPELPKEITMKATGVPKKPALAMKEVAGKNGKSTPAPAKLTSRETGHHASVGARAPAAKPTSAHQTSPSKGGNKSAPAAKAAPSANKKSTADKTTGKR